MPRVALTDEQRMQYAVKDADHFGVSLDFLVGRGMYSLSDAALQYAKQFDELPEDKKQLAIAYMGVVRAQ